MFKRPMVIIAISYIIGIIMGLYFKINTAFFIFANFVVLCTIFLIAIKYFDSRGKFESCNGILNRVMNYYNIKDLEKFCSKLQRWFFYIFICVAICIVSYCYIKHAQKKYENIYHLDNNQVRLKGTVVDEKKPSNYYNKYVVKVDSINNNKQYKGIKVILRIKKSKNINEQKLKNGDIISCSCVMEKPSIRRNYNGFDYAETLKTQKIYMICKTQQNELTVTGSKSQFRYKVWITSMRNRVKNNLNELLDAKNSNIANALFIGVSNDITDEQREVFNNASLIHVLAISGMHVGYMLVFLKFILKMCDKRRSKYLYIILLFIFADLTGNSPSVQRAVIMSSVMISSKLFYRKSDSINNIAISCLILLMINPYYILNLGFQLSFLGTLGIIIFYPKITNIVDRFTLKSLNTNNEKHSNKTIKNEKAYIKETIIKAKSAIKSVILIGISANLLMLPVIIYSSNCLSFVFLVSTILITPILGIMIFSGYITIFISLFSIKLASIPAVILRVSITIFNGIAQFSSNLSILRFTVPTPSIIIIICYYICIFYMFFLYRSQHKKLVFKALTCILIICVCTKYIAFMRVGMKMYFIDVGQGDSSLIITETNKTILIDGGRK